MKRRRTKARRTARRTRGPRGGGFLYTTQAERDAGCERYAGNGWKYGKIGRGMRPAGDGNFYRCLSPLEQQQIQQGKAMASQIFS